MDPHQYCQAKAAASGSSFYYSFLFLPQETRRAITAFYALCRELDDVVDECHDQNVAANKLDWWRSELERMARGTPEHPVTRALIGTLQGRTLPQELLLEIVDGMAMDLDHKRYPDFKTLQLYCYRVAGVVGELAARIFGYKDMGTCQYAHDLGLAFQLTNIIRDVGEDARRGRIYLPQAELDQFNVSEADILQSRPTPDFKLMMQFQYERAHGFYTKALAELPTVDRKAQRPGLVMAAIYHALLNEIHRDAFPVLQGRVSLTPVRKLWLASKTWLTA
ncbi:MAG: presqualene diphosphate synthase HpnD [Thiobacillaceae bacterium]